MALKFLDFSAAEHEYTSLTEREREVVVITLGGLWQAEYELYAHVTLGRVAGLSESNVKAIASGDLPAELSEREKIVGRVTRKLAVDHRIDDSLYKTAEQTFGRKGMFDIVAIMGQYLLTSTLLTMFMVPAPE
jgi:4-carboxymuconolactone decarboxylase